MAGDRTCDGCLCGIPADSFRDIDGAEVKVGHVRSVVIIETAGTLGAAHPEGDEVL
jgi:hypothetical protein